MEDPAAEAAFREPRPGACRQGLRGLIAISGGAARRALPLRRSCSPLVGGGVLA